MYVRGCVRARHVMGLSAVHFGAEMMMMMMMMLHVCTRQIFISKVHIHFVFTKCTIEQCRDK